MATRMPLRRIATHSNGAKRHAAELQAEQARAIKAREKRNSEEVRVAPAESGGGDDQSRRAAAVRTLSALSPEQQRDMWKLFGQRTRDKVLTTIVKGFVVVMILSAVILAAGVFLPANGKVAPELVFSLFTSVVGFLAGLFISPPGKPDAEPKPGDE
jgi:hypothetical protein